MYNGIEDHVEKTKEVSRKSGLYYIYGTLWEFHMTSWQPCLLTEQKKCFPLGNHFSCHVKTLHCCITMKSFYDEDNVRMIVVSVIIVYGL